MLEKLGKIYNAYTDLLAKDTKVKKNISCCSAQDMSSLHALECRTKSCSLICTNLIHNHNYVFKLVKKNPRRLFINALEFILHFFSVCTDHPLYTTLTRSYANGGCCHARCRPAHQERYSSEPQLPHFKIAVNL